MIYNWLKRVYFRLEEYKIREISEDIFDESSQMTAQDEKQQESAENEPPGDQSSDSGLSLEERKELRKRLLEKLKGQSSPSD